MTVEWLMKILSSTSYSSDKNNIDNNFLPNSNTKSIIPTPVSPVRPILSSGTNNNNIYYPSDYGADFKERQASLPVFSPDYPAFFILILLVTLTSFALFVLLFLCCLDGKDLAPDEERGDFPVESTEDEPEPPAKDVGTETDPSHDSNSLIELDAAPSDEVEDVVEIENETEIGVEEATEEAAEAAAEEEEAVASEESDEKPTVDETAG